MSEEMAIAFIDLDLSVCSLFANRNKTIVNKLSGGFKFGTISALMGASGSGKTTLLKAINGSNRYLIGAKTQIYYSLSDTIRSCFINQDQNERLMKGLTVGQCLTYASRLKNSSVKVAVNHKQRVKQLMDELLISDIKNSRVNDCSGGELKRLVIAMELTSVLLPNVMFIDEPTTGLDSNAAECAKEWKLKWELKQNVVISCLKTLSVKHSICIITSIHQPNNALLQMFDNIYVLSKHGYCLYAGQPRHIQNTLKQCGIESTEFQIPIEVLLKYSSKPENDKYVQKLCAKTAELRENLVQRCADLALRSSKQFSRNCSKRFNFTDFWCLLHRAAIFTYICQWKALLFQLLFYVLFLLCLTFAYNSNIGKVDGCYSFGDLLDYSCDEVEKQMALIEQNLYHEYIASISLLTMHTAIATSNFLFEMSIFSTEHQNRWYSTGSYYWAKTLLEQISSIIFGYSFTIIMYSIGGQVEESSRFYKYLFTSLSGFMCTQTLGSIIGIAFNRSHRLALSIAVASYSILHYFNNFIVPTKDLFQIFQTFSDFLFPKYLFNSMLITLYGFGRCAEGETSLVLYQYGLKEDEIFWNNSLYLIYTYLVLKCFELILLLLKANKLSINIWRLFNVKIKNDNVTLVENSPGHNLESNYDNVVNGSDIDLCEEFVPKPMIAWIDLSFAIRPKICGKRKTILDNINGSIEFGSLNGLLGPSGSGKTTLLRCLNGRNNRGLSPETKIFLNSRQKIINCFVTQDVCEHLLNGLTAKQTLVYASKLKNSLNAITSESIESTVSELMSELLISETANTFVESCSGGQRKRLAIASELTAQLKPNFLCIDEPTSGLDSDAADEVIKCLKQLTRKHKISIMASIHQPNYELFLMFDNIHVLAKGGLTVYSGSPVRLKQQLFECNIYCNEFEASIEKLLKHSSQGLCDKYIARMHRKTQLIRRNLIDTCADTHLIPTANGIETKAKTFRFIDFWYLFVRNIRIAYISQWKLLLMQFLICICVAIPFTRSLNQDIVKPDGCYYSNSSSSDATCAESLDDFEEQSLISLNIKYNLVFITAITFLQIVVTPLTFTTDVKVFLNQQRNGWYSTGAYYWSKQMVDMVPVILTLIPYCEIFNKYDSTDKYFTYLSLITVCTLCSQTVGHISGIIFSANSRLALISSFGIHFSFMILSNTIIPIKEFHQILQYLSDISYLRHTFECILIMIYGFDRCADGKVSAVLHRYGITDQMFWQHIRNLILVFIALKFIALFLLIFKTNFLFRNIKRNKKLEKNFDSNEQNLQTIVLNDFDYSFDSNNFTIDRRKIFYV